MKGSRIVVAAFFCFLAAIASDARDRPGIGDSQLVMATVGQLLEQSHYTRHKLDAGMGRQILEVYLGSLDLNKLFFTEHSEYLGPSDLNQFKIDTRLTISGIGAEIRMKDGYATIDRIFSSGPADRSRELHVGDKIVSVAEGNGPFVNIVHAMS